MKPVLLFYGNCQVGALSFIFKNNLAVLSSFEVAYLPSFDDRESEKTLVGPLTLSEAAISFEQYDAAPFPHPKLLPSSCLRVTFPSLDLGILWPLSCTNKYNEPSTVDSPWGRFPYGDRLIIECVDRGLSVSETLQYYEAYSASRLPELGESISLEEARQAERDAKCTVPMGDVLMKLFRSEKLFWSVNHPTLLPIRELCRRLVEEAKHRSRALQWVALDETISSLPPLRLSDFHIPIHPKLAESLNLQWYVTDARRQYGSKDKVLSYQEYFATMTKCAVKVRDSGRVAQKV